MGRELKQQPEKISVLGKATKYWVLEWLYTYAAVSIKYWKTRKLEIQFAQFWNFSNNNNNSNNSFNAYCPYRGTLYKRHAIA